MTVKSKTIKVTLIKSGIGQNERRKRVLKGMGLTKLNKTVVLKDTSAVRGMINKVIQLVQYEAGASL